MTYEVPEHRRDALQETVDALLGAERLVFTTHVNGDGDGIGSEIALAHWLRELGKDVRIINPTPFPEMYDSILPDRSWVLEAGTVEADQACAKADLGVVLDTSEIPRIGRMKPAFDEMPRWVIDHHPVGDRPIDGPAYRDPTACATGELVYEIIVEGGGTLDRTIAEALYTALTMDTGGFRFSNTTPRTHIIVADLLRHGARPEVLSRRLFGSYPLRHFRVLEASLGELEVDADGMVAWMTVPKEAVATHVERPDDLEGLVDYPRMVDGVEAGLLFRETSEGFTKVSFRSNGEVNVNVLARRFGGGGHVKASGALVRGKIEEVRPQVVEATVEAAREVRGDPVLVSGSE